MIIGPATVASVFDLLADAGQILAGIVAAAALAGLWIQLRQQANDGQVALITGMTMLISEVGQAFIDYPEMRKYFYDDRAPGASDAARACAIAVTLAGAMDHVAAHFDTKAMDEASRSAWLRYFRDIHDGSPVFREHLRTNGHWYGPKFREAIGDALSPATSAARRPLRRTCRR